MSTNAFLQARMSSTRLPGKVLKQLNGKPMLITQVERIKLANTIDNVIVCTSLNREDDAIEQVCKAHQIDCFRGSLSNVLQRFVDAESAFPADNIVRLTADCPLTDPAIIDAVVDLHIAKNNDFTSNCNPYTLPDGLDVEVLTTNTLKYVIQKAFHPDHFEHVTKYIYEYSNEFKIGNFEYPKDYSNHRWTVDYQEDFEFVDQVLNKLPMSNKVAGIEEIMSLLNENPELKTINYHHIET